MIAWDDELPGFAVVIGRTSQSFIVNDRADGSMRRQVIGRRGAIREDGHAWTDGVRCLRWEDVDFDEDLIRIRNAKGDRPYTIPMVPYRRCMAPRLLDQRTSRVS